MLLGEGPQENFRSSGGSETIGGLSHRVAELEAVIARQKQQLDEMGDLLKEVNHRAKNSLQFAMAMLSMQALASDDTTVAEALNAASQRLSYLARVHELLYQRGDDIQAIDVAEFLVDIIEALRSAFSRDEVDVRLVAEPLVLATSQAINVALIAGEALLNAYKYAFPSGRVGQVEVQLSATDSVVELSINDNGVGFSAEQRRGSLGMRLLRALGRALGGETIIKGEAGTSVAVAFPVTSGPTYGTCASTKDDPQADCSH